MKQIHTELMNSIRQLQDIKYEKIKTNVHKVFDKTINVFNKHISPQKLSQPQLNNASTLYPQAIKAIDDFYTSQIQQNIEIANQKILWAISKDDQAQCIKDLKKMNNGIQAMINDRDIPGLDIWNFRLEQFLYAQQFV